jgi:2-oxo-4-hydroxy-4-carboxy-5-ureidoimidazoline decarboxylase
MNDALARWNGLQFFEAAEELLPCCGSKAWARGVAARRPIHDEAALLITCDEVWKELPESDWMEAFRSHPRIGESRASTSALAQSVSWSKTEQQRVSAGDDEVKRALAEGNRAYEQRFKRIFIVCASGKSAIEILEILRRRLRNDDKTELQEAAEQQRQITRIRLRKWISS